MIVTRQILEEWRDELKEEIRRCPSDWDLKRIEKRIDDVYQDIGGKYTLGSFNFLLAVIALVTAVVGVCV